MAPVAVNSTSFSSTTVVSDAPFPVVTVDEKYANVALITVSDKTAIAIIVIAISSGLGGTYNVIRLIGEDYKDRLKITVIDSKITSFVEGLLAIKTKELVDKGVDTETIVKEIKDKVKEYKSCYTLVIKIDRPFHN